MGTNGLPRYSPFMRTPVGRAAGVVRAMSAMTRMVSKLLLRRDDLTHHSVRQLSRCLPDVPRHRATARFRADKAEDSLKGAIESARRFKTID